MIKKKKSKNIDFLLENKHYKRLHLMLYLISITIITLVYFLTILVFSQYFHFLVTTIFSFFIGLYVLMNRNRIVRMISDHLQDRKREEYKKKSKDNLKTTLRNITPKNKKLKLNIKGTISMKDKIIAKIKPKDKKTKDRGYIEIK